MPRKRARRLDDGVTSGWERETPGFTPDRGMKSSGTERRTIAGRILAARLMDSPDTSSSSSPQRAPDASAQASRGLAEAPLASPGHAGAATPAARTAGGRSTRASITRTFDSLRVPEFRALWIGLFIGMAGMQMMMIARTILVDELTGSAFLTGLVTMGFAPTMLVTALFGGVAGDRLERRSVIQATQAASAVLSGAIAVLILFGVINWVHMLVQSLLQGVTFAFMMPARQAIIPRLVGREQVTNAISLSSGAMNLMAVAAPAFAGVIYSTLGPAAVYFIITGLYVGAIVLTGRVPRVPPDRAGAGQPVLSNIAAGLRYVRTNRLVLLLLSSGLIVALLAMPFRMQLPVFARRLYGSEPSEIGGLMAFAGIGGILGTLFIARLGKGNRRGLLLLAGAIVNGFGLLLIGLFPIYFLGLAFMILVGLAESIRMTLGQSLTLEVTEDQYRARVMSLMMMTFGLMPLGALPIGKAVDVWGAQYALLGVACAVILAGTVFLAGAHRLRRYS
ncbi:MAG: MFS transporter [Chloroflexi bacterium]|nr:MFS transporter [Chloroflexota bacterium]